MSSYSSASFCSLAFGGRGAEPPRVRGPEILFVLHRHQAQTVRGCARIRSPAIARVDDRGECRAVDLPATGPEERPYDGAHHAAQERVRRDLEADERAL